MPKACNGRSTVTLNYQVGESGRPTRPTRPDADEAGTKSVFTSESALLRFLCRVDAMMASSRAFLAGGAATEAPLQLLCIRWLLSVALLMTTSRSCNILDLSVAFPVNRAGCDLRGLPGPFAQLLLLLVDLGPS